MPRKLYPVEREGSRRLEVAWKNPWKEMTIRLDGQLVSSALTREELQAGRQFTLPDGSILQVQLVKHSIDTELHILRNGKPIPGSYTDPLSRYKLAYGILLGVTALYLGLGIISVLTRSAFLQGLGVGPYSVILGVIFTLLSFFVKRRSAVALGAAVVVLVTDALLSAAFDLIGGRPPGLLGLALRGALAFPMLDGMEAIRELKSQEEEPE